MLLAFHDELVGLRRDLHREPEVGLHLPRTQRAVLAALADLPLEVTTGTALSSVTAVLHGGRPGPTVLLRGDMDALPLTERTGLPYAATNGAMHACGHDLHTAGLVGAAKLLCEARERLAGNVVFMFQPGEEGAFGARLMIEEGLLDASGELPVAAYALHVTSSMYPHGTFVSRPGLLMAASDTLRVVLHGTGGHGAMPHRARDPIPALCEMVLALQSFVTRRFDVFEPVVLTVGNLHAGSKVNVIATEARFEATIRSFSAGARALVREGAPRIVRGVAAAHDLPLDVECEEGYPAVVTAEDEAAFAERTVAELFGEARYLTRTNPIPGSEDFAFVLEQVPGTFLFLSACPPDLDPATAPTNHAPEAVFDDNVLSDGARLLAELAIRRLARP